MTVRYLFDTGPEGTALTSGNTGATSIITTGGGVAVFAAAMAAHGTYGAKFTGTNITCAARCAVETSGLQQAWSFVWTTPAVALTTGNVMTFFTGRSGTGVIFRLQWLNGTVQLLDGSSTLTQATVTVGGSNTVLSTNTQYRFEINATVGSTTSNGAMALSIYNTSGTKVGAFTTTTSNFGAGVAFTAFDAGLQAGISTAVTLGYDDVQVSSGTSGEIGAYNPAVNAPPVVSAGADKTVSVGSVVSQTGTATDADGTIASTVWSFDTYPSSLGSAPTLTGGSTLNASFTPTVAGLYTLRLTATDNLGSATPSVATIYVPASSVTPIGVTENSGVWVNQGGAVNIQTALSDGLSTTYIESPASPGTEKTITVRLAPLNPLSAATIALTDTSYNGSGNLTVTVDLMEGSTVRQTWTVTLGGEVDLTLSSGTITAIVSWNALDLRFGVVAA